MATPIAMPLADVGSGMRRTVQGNNAIFAPNLFFNEHSVVALHEKKIAVVPRGKDRWGATLVDARRAKAQIPWNIRVHRSLIILAACWDDVVLEVGPLPPPGLG